MTSWADHAILWHVYPLGFTGAERAALPAHEPVRHRLRQLEAWLDYAVELGCNGLLLGPVFAAESHGYDTIDHFRIDTRLGDEGDFDALVTAADQRGLRLVLDGVFNHVGRSFPAFRAALAGGPSTPAARWFKRTPDGSDYAVFEGHGHLVELDHDEPAVLSYVVEVMTHWLGRGAAGWRLDAAYAVPPAFWAKAVSAVRETFPDAWFLGEMIHGDYAAYANEAGLDSITQYEVWKAIWSSLNDRNFYELDHALGRHNAFMDGELRADVRRQPRRDPAGDGAQRRPALLARPRGPVLRRRRAERLLRRRAGIPRPEGGPGGRRRRDQARVPRLARRELLPDGWRHYRLHQRLIGFRRRHPWLVRARTDGRAPASSRRWRCGFAARAPGEQVLLLLNVGDEPEFRFARGHRRACRSPRRRNGGGRRRRRPAARPGAQLDDPGLSRPRAAGR